MNRAIYRVREGFQDNRKKLWAVGTVILLVLAIITILFVTKTVTAKRNEDRIKLITSVEIRKGDTLWSIASDYISDEYGDMNDYIREIKESNGITSDNIHAGNYIIVPYYADNSY